MVRDGVFSLSDQNFTNADNWLQLSYYALTNAIICVCLFYLCVYVYFSLSYYFYYFSFHIGMSLHFFHFIVYSVYEFILNK